MTRRGVMREDGGEQTVGIWGGGRTLKRRGRCGRLTVYKVYAAGTASEALGGPMHTVSCGTNTGRRVPGNLCQRSRGWGAIAALLSKGYGNAGECAAREGEGRYCAFTWSKSISLSLHVRTRRRASHCVRICSSDIIVENNDCCIC